MAEQQQQPSVSMLLCSFSLPFTKLLAVCLVSTLDWDNMAGIPQDICHLDSAAFSRFGLKLSLSGYNVGDPYSLG